MIASSFDHTDSLPDRISLASRRPGSLGVPVSGAISLAMGEPDGGTPPQVLDAAVHALRNGRTRYGPITGSPPLREAVAQHLSQSSGLALDEGNVVLTHGGSAGLASAILALVRPGDRVLLPEPTYSLYADHLAMVGAEAVWIANLADGTLDLERLAVTAATARMIVLCNPVNPTGVVFPDANVRGLGEILRAHPGLFLLADEAYRDIVFDGTCFASAMSLEDVIDRVVIVGTFSKTYAMTGWRLGFVCAAPDVAAPINLVHRTFNGPLNTFVQDAALAALRIPDDQLGVLARSYERRRDVVMSCLNALTNLDVVTPRGAFYAFPRIDCGLSSEQLSERFARGGVLVRSGSEFGPSGEGHVRLSFATDEASLREGLRRFAAVVKGL